MDAALLTDPAFWESGGSFAPAGFPGRLPDHERLEGHVLFETSGSSGSPKWIALSKQALLISAAAVNRHLGVDEKSVWGLVLPLHHVGGFGVIARAFEAGCRFDRFRGKWEPHLAVEWLGRSGVTHLSLVPTQMYDLVAARLSAPSALKVVVVGGGRLDHAVGQAARELGWPVLASYGMTECGSQIATQPPELLELPYQPAPIPLLPIWKAETDDERRLKVSGPALFSGTLGRDDGDWCFRERAGDWHRTSDRVLIHDRALTPLSRADFLVKVMGELVDPEAIERELDRLADGRLTAGKFAVVARPDARQGHRLVPVFEQPVDADAVSKVLAGYREIAPGFRRLEAPVLLESFPRSELGKILRPVLAEWLPKS